MPGSPSFDVTGSYGRLSGSEYGMGIGGTFTFAHRIVSLQNFLRVRVVVHFGTECAEFQYNGTLVIPSRAFDRLDCKRHGESTGNPANESFSLDPLCKRDAG